MLKTILINFRRFLSISVRMILLGSLLVIAVGEFYNAFIDKKLGDLFSVLVRPSFVTLILALILLILSQPIFNKVNKIFWFLSLKDGEWALVYRAYIKTLIFASFTVGVAAILSYIFYSPTFNWWKLPIGEYIFGLYLLVPIWLVAVSLKKK